jgi:hypothetical protein
VPRLRRRQEALELAQRYKDLPHPEEMGRVVLVMFVSALVSGAFQTALLRLYVKLFRQLWRNRQHGVRATAAGSDYRLVVLSTLFYWCYSALNKVLLLRLARRGLERAEHEMKASQKKPPA